MPAKTEILRSIFRIDLFRSSQDAVIDHVLSGRHALVIMPTGMGKSLCFQVPALCMDGLSIVVSPLIALMKDQVDGLLELGVDATFINSSLAKAERLERYRGIAEGRYRILYVTPERFRKSEFIEALSGRRVALLAVDEAHCISEWGHDFRPDYTRLAEFRAIIGNPVTIALTATATPDIQEDIMRQLGIPADEMRIFHEGIARANLALRVTEVIEEKEKLAAILSDLAAYPGSQIIYFTLIRTLERFSELLHDKRVRHIKYHGQLDPRSRRAAQDAFMSHPDRLVLATNAFGMGVDKADVRLIIHAELPSSVEAYYQEIGRAGRDDKPSLCHLLYCQDDLLTQMEFVRWRNPNASFLRDTWDLLAKLKEGVNSFDYEHLQEHVVHRHRADHRLETALNLFDRHGVTAGDLDRGTLRLVQELPAQLRDEEYLARRERKSYMNLQSLVNFIRSENCRKEFIHDHFGVPSEKCGNCDRCGTSPVSETRQYRLPEELPL